MSYFPNSFHKVFKVASVVNADGTNIEALTAGQLGLIDPATHKTLNNVAPFPKQAYIAVGSYRTSDKIGPFAGGYKESSKSKGINPNYINRFYKVAPLAAQHQIVKVGYDGTNAGSKPVFLCGQTYNLRLDLKGGPLLRALNRNAYKTLSAFTGCCADPQNPTQIDPAVVMIDWALQIFRDPVLNQFIKATVISTDGTTPTSMSTEAALLAYAAQDPATWTASLVLEDIYSPTVFSNCSFERTDHFELDFVEITAAQLVDENGQPCNGFKQLKFTETQAIKVPTNTGEHWLRQLILSDSYQQNFRRDDPRMRDVEGYAPEGIINRNARYQAYYLLHTVPRSNNPSSTFDNDQYTLAFVFDEGFDTSSFETLINAFIATGKSNVVLESL